MLLFRPHADQLGHSLLGLSLTLLFAFCATAGSGRADELQLFRVNGFPNAKALPLHAGIAKGIFAKRGINVELQLTDSSKAQRDGLAAEKFEIAHAALDNAIAMVEGAQQDVVIVSGGDSGMNEFFVQGDIKSFADLRGRIVVVDAPDTAYALQIKKILLREGLKNGADYTIKPVGAGVYRLKAMAGDKANAGAILNLPFTVQAEELGMKSLGRTIDLLGPYQATGGFVRRAWARSNGPLLERYLAAYIEALRWVRDPANKVQNVALLREKLQLSQAAADRTYQLLVDPEFGFTPDAKFDLAGFKNNLALRADAKISRGEALRQAMMALLDSQGFTDETGKMLFTYGHPLFWAPYMIIGDGG